MTKRTITLLALAFTLAGAGTANAATQPTSPAPLTPLTLRTARFIITNDTGGALSLTRQSTFVDDTWREAPGDIADRGIGDYTVTTASNQDVGADLDYSLPGGDYGLFIHGANPRAEPNNGECEIQLTSATASKPPFSCSIHEDKKDYNDTNFEVVVTRTGGTAAADHRATR